MIDDKGRCTERSCRGLFGLFRPRWTTVHIDPNARGTHFIEQDHTVVICGEQIELFHAGPGLGGYPTYEVA